MVKQTQKRAIYNDFTGKIFNFFSGVLFFRLIIIASILQGVWYAINFRPTIYDEGTHLGIITVYSHQVGPFISQQPVSQDFLGAITRNASYLYYYLMSWPLKLFDIFISSEQGKIILLRMINVGLFALGLIIYRQVIILAKGPRIIANLSLLFLILTPSLAPLNGSLSYDNAVFLFTAMLLYLSINLISTKKVNAKNLSLLFIIGMLGSLIKFEFIALFIPVIIYICYDLWKKHGSKLAWLFRQSYSKLSLTIKIMLVCGLLLASMLFVERHVVNIIKYRKINPNCTQIIDQKRCLKNYTAKRNIQAQDSKPKDFSPINPFNYMLEEWIPGMITTQTILPPSQLSSRVLRLLYYFVALFGGLLVIYYLKDFIKKDSYRFLIVIAGIYAIVLAAYNYQAYTTLGIPVAITGRYLLPVLPIFVMFILLAFGKLLQQNRRLIIIGLFCTLVIFSQGGGITTYLIAAKSEAYWPSKQDTNINYYFRDKLKGVIKLSEAN